MKLHQVYGTPDETFERFLEVEEEGAKIISGRPSPSAQAKGTAEDPHCGLGSRPPLTHSDFQPPGLGLYQPAGCSGLLNELWNGIARDIEHRPVQLARGIYQQGAWIQSHTRIMCLHAWQMKLQEQIGCIQKNCR